MKGLLIGSISALALIFIIGVWQGVKIMLRVFREHASQRGEIERMRHVTQAQQLKILYHEDKHSLWVEMREELVEAWKGKGLGLGIYQSIEKTHELAMDTGKALGNAQVDVQNAANYRAQMELDRNAKRQLSAANTQMEAQRDQAKARLMQVQEQLREAREKLKQVEETPYIEASEIRPRIVPLPSENRPKGVRKSSDIAPKAVQDGFGTDEIPEILEYEPDEHYVMQDKIESNGWQGVVVVKHELLNKVVGEFRVSELKRGQVHIVEGTAIKVVLCELPSCYKVKITKQMTTRCCSREHTRQLEKLNIRKANHG